MEDKIALLGMTLAELKAVAGEIGMPSFAARQMAEWLYGKKVASIDEMTNISAKNRRLLNERYTVGCAAPVDGQRSADGTVKYLYRTAAGGYVETVYIPDGDRATLCVSSQVGCRMNCRFCMTGKQGFSGQLTAADILNQLYSLPERETLTNVVFMGQGEPLDNLDNVLRATEILTADYGYAWSPKRITVSTVGLRKGLKRFLDESECHLAVSLHNPFADQRARLMPAENSYALREIVTLLREYASASSFFRIYDVRRGERYPGACQGTLTLARRIGVPDESDSFPSCSRCGLEGDVGGRHVALSGLSDRTRTFFYHPGIARTGYFCRLRVVEHGEATRCGTLINRIGL